MNGLEIVRARRLEEARTHAQQSLDAARADAQGRRRDAEAEAAALISSARHEGELSADSDTGRQWTAARRRARAIVLAAQRAAYEDLVNATVVAVTGDARYGSLLEHVADESRRLLGPGSEVQIRQDGVIASRRRRNVRWDVREAVERSVERPGLEELWR